MENNIENKAKFFAQYWGQKVKSSYLPEQNEPCTIDANTFKIFHLVINGVLRLKSLSDISDEDAIEISTIYYSAFSENDRSLDDKMIFRAKQIIRCLVNSKKYNEHGLWSGSIELIDFLRSKGYLLPWMGLSTEELISRGWAVVK